MRFRHFTNSYFCDILLNRGKEKSPENKIKMKEVIKMFTRKDIEEMLETTLTDEEWQKIEQTLSFLTEEEWDFEHPLDE